MRNPRSYWTPAQERAVRKGFTSGMDDDAIAESIQDVRPGVTAVQVGSWRARNGLLRRRPRKKAPRASQTPRGQVPITVGNAGFTTDPDTARTIIDILAGI